MNPRNKRKRESVSMSDLMERAIPEPNSGCLLWMRGASKLGYGHISVEGRDTYVHRLSYEIANGVVVPDGIEVLHRCDTPSCINPDHLSAGTHTDNMRDASRKGRMGKNKNATSSTNTSHFSVPPYDGRAGFRSIV